MRGEIYRPPLKGGLEGFGNAIIQDFEDSGTQIEIKETKDLILDPLSEFGNSRKFEQAGDHSSLPEQLVIDENESPGNTELGGGGGSDHA